MSPFLAELQAYLDARRAAGDGIALLLLDCGVIGQLDATWGYAVGDAGREFLASRLRAEALREQDLLVDAGRDDFACALACVTDPSVAQLAAEKLLRALDAPLWIGDDEIYASPAAGIVLVPADSADAATLLGQAKAASRAARERPDQIAMFAPGDGRPGAAKLPFDARLRAAILQESMEFLFRPQFDVRTGMLAGADCVLGWSDGTVQARDAIAVAQDARRANEATRWVIGGVLRHCTELRQGCGVDIHVGVNLSARHLHLGDLAESILGLLKVWNLRPSRLALGIADTAALAQRPQAREILKALGSAGVRLALDDPSAGPSVFAELEPLAFAEYRLDPALLRELPASTRRQGIVKAMAGLAHELRLDVLADGVADAATAACLKDLGCDILQGDHIGRLVDAQGFIDAHRQ